MCSDVFLLRCTHLFFSASSSIVELQMLYCLVNLVFVAVEKSALQNVTIMSNISSEFLFTSCPWCFLLPALCVGLVCLHNHMTVDNLFTSYMRHSLAKMVNFKVCHLKRQTGCFLVLKKGLFFVCFLT